MRVRRALQNDGRTQREDDTCEFAAGRRGVLEEGRAAEDAAVPRVDEDRGRENEGAAERAPSWVNK